jgi:hypothetical protein
MSSCKGKLNTNTTLGRTRRACSALNPPAYVRTIATSTFEIGVMASDGNTVNVADINGSPLASKAVIKNVEESMSAVPAVLCKLLLGDLILRHVGAFWSQ